MVVLTLVGLLANLNLTSGTTSSPGQIRFQEHFLPEDYGAYPQNWAIAFDQAGLAYVGNRDGVLQYDGENWRLLPTERRSTVRSLGVDSRGTIFVGGQGEIGFMSVGETGFPEYVSLLRHIPPELHDFHDVWGIYPTGHGVFFQTSNYVFLWDGNEFQHWSSAGGFHTLHGIANRVFVRENGVGLLEYMDGHWELVEGGEAFSEKRIGAILPVSQYEALIVSRNAGLYSMVDRRIQKVNSSAERVLLDADIYGGCLANDGNLILATLTRGIIVLSPLRTIVDVFDREQGLPDRVVNAVALSPQGELWAALNSKGILRMDYRGPMEVFDETHGIEGTIAAIERTGDYILVATGSGLFWRRIHDSQFQRVPSIRRAWSLARTEAGLLVGSDEGLYHIELDSFVVTRLTDDQSFVIVRSKHAAGKFLIGTRWGISLVDEALTGQPILSVKADDEIRSIVEDEEGNYWVATRSNGVRVLDGRDLMDGRLTVVDIGSRALERRGRVSLLDVAGTLHFARQDAELLIYNQDRRTFLESPLRAILKQEALSDTLLFSVRDGSGVSWIVLPNRVVHVWKADGAYRVLARPILRFENITQARILVEDSGVAWISLGDELFRYDPHVVKDYDVPYTTLVRTVMDSRTDSILFGGHFRTKAGGMGTVQMEEDVPRFSYEFNNLKFQFAAPTFNTPGKTLYQYRLSGREEEWSEWSRTTSVSYSGLDKGSYMLQVRARNGFGYLSGIGSYSFHLLPPWHRTWWAYGLYALGLAAFASLSWKYAAMVKAHRQAKQQAKELARERVINEKLNEANEQLQTANLRLVEVNTLKDEFLATTSHELRTPITAILGYASLLKEEIPSDYHEFVEIIEKSGDRLMGSLNSLLDLAELRSGTYDLTVEPFDVNGVIREMAEEYSTGARERGLSFDVTVPGWPMTIRSDRGAVAKILAAVVGNAVKFTETGGVRISVSADAGEVRVSVSDTGVGIDDNFLPELFDEFKQESGGLARSHSGSGLGLAIAGKLVDLLGGSVEVETEKGVGTTFTVTLPVDVGETESQAPSVGPAGEIGPDGPAAAVRVDRESIRSPEPRTTRQPDAPAGEIARQVDSVDLGEAGWDGTGSEQVDRSEHAGSPE